jgi:hypothetical protein
LAVPFLIFWLRGPIVSARPVTCPRHHFFPSFFVRVYGPSPPAGMRRFRPRGGHQNSPFRARDYMVSYVVVKLAPNPSYLTRRFVKSIFVPFPSQNGDKYVIFPPSNRRAGQLGMRTRKSGDDVCLFAFDQCPRARKLPSVSDGQARLLLGEVRRID